MLQCRKCFSISFLSWWGSHCLLANWCTQGSFHSPVYPCRKGISKWLSSKADIKSSNLKAYARCVDRPFRNDRSCSVFHRQSFTSWLLFLLLTSSTSSWELDGSTRAPPPLDGQACFWKGKKNNSPLHLLVSIFPQTHPSITLSYFLFKQWLDLMFHTRLSRHRQRPLTSIVVQVLVRERRFRLCHSWVFRLQSCMFPLDGGRTI